MQSEASTLPDLTFAANSFVGNLGAPFRASDENGDDDEPQGLRNKDHGWQDHEFQEQNREGQGTLIVEGV